MSQFIEQFPISSLGLGPLVVRRLDKKGSTII